MNQEIKTIFKGYIFGYLNEYYNYQYWLKNRDISYKKAKIERTARYLGIADKNLILFSKAIKIVAKFEWLLSISILVLKLVAYIFKSILTKKIKLSMSNIAFGLDPSEEFLVSLLKSVDLDRKDIVLVKMPLAKASFTGFKLVSLFSGISLNEIFKSFVLSIKLVLFINKKYSRRDFLFRAYSSFEYFMAYFYIQRSSTTNSYWFNSTYDRWSFIFGKISHSTYFIQHGILNGDIELIKVGSANYAYYINTTQREICENLLFKNKPVVLGYRKGLVLNSDDRLVANGQKNLLLVCNSLFFAKEMGIISDLSLREINLYVKPHPTDNLNVYMELLSEHNFVILDKNEYPRVDFVISYFSTLADEYEKNGATVLRYEDADFYRKYKEILN